MLRRNEYNKEKLALLRVWQEEKIKLELDAGGEEFMGLPDRWYEPRPTYRCSTGHISRTYLKSEELGYNACLACYEPLVMTFPEDNEDIVPPGLTRCEKEADEGS